jgi:hypothetical protein
LQLQKVNLANEDWFIDERLKEVRKVNNPFEILSFDEFRALKVIENNLRGD